MIISEKIFGIASAAAVIILITGTEIPLWATEPTQVSPSRQEKIQAQIKTLPYLSGYKPAPQRTGVTFYDESRVCNGLNLYSSGGSPPVVLMDMGGNVLHEWNNNLPYPNLKESFFRRVHLFPNGDILAILEEKGLLKMDKDSNIIWFLRGQYHHDLEIAENGDIYILTRRDSKIDQPKIHLNGEIKEDFITILNPEGKEKSSISLLKCFLNSDYSSTLRNIQLNKYSGDIFHTNTLELIPSSASKSFPLFQEGHALISLRNLSTIAVVDLSNQKVTWALSGMWAYQHQPTVLSNGNILLFDNLGQEGKSKVIEFNPCTQEVVWAYRGNADNGFRTVDMGFQQRLSNGNTLITESRDGRVFEVTPDNMIVWEFFNPQRSGINNNLIATIFEMTRINPVDLSFLGKIKPDRKD